MTTGTLIALIAAAVLLIVNAIWKIILMKEEKSLIEAGKEHAA